MELESARGRAVTMVTEKVCGPPTSQRNAASPRNPRSLAEWKKTTSFCCFVFLFFSCLLVCLSSPTPPRRPSRSALRHAEECKPLSIKDNSEGLWVIMCHRCVIRLAGFCNQPPHFPKQKVNSDAESRNHAEPHKRLRRKSAVMALLTVRM